MSSPTSINSPHSFLSPRRVGGGRGGALLHERNTESCIVTLTQRSAGSQQITRDIVPCACGDQPSLPRWPKNEVAGTRDDIGSLAEALRNMSVTTYSDARPCQSHFARSFPLLRSSGLREVSGRAIRARQFGLLKNRCAPSGAEWPPLGRRVMLAWLSLHSSGCRGCSAIRHLPCALPRWLERRCHEPPGAVGWHNESSLSHDGIPPACATRAAVSMRVSFGVHALAGGHDASSE
ncbi:hypothetical protein VUR80DRAFT_2185 [Thermomyces stellatus]